MQQYLALYFQIILKASKHYAVHYWVWFYLDKAVCQQTGVITTETNFKYKNIKMNTQKIGWIGLGKMGVPMCEQLIKAGFTVSAYNRTKEKEKAVEAMGASVSATPLLLIQTSDVIVVMVTDDAAIQEVFMGKDGLLAANTSGKIIINMSTVSPAVSKQMAALCQQQGNAYLDAPVSGSVKQAQEGQLAIMVGGQDAAFNEAKPVFDKLGKMTLLVGENGAGNTAKLAINALLGVYAQGLAETVLFAQNNGIKTTDLLTLIGNSALGNIFTKIKGDAIINNNYEAAFALKHIAKDLRLAKAEGMKTPLATSAFTTFTKAEARFGDEDIIAVIKGLE